MDVNRCDSVFTTPKTASAKVSEIRSRKADISSRLRSKSAHFSQDTARHKRRYVYVSNGTIDGVIRFVVSAQERATYPTSEY